MGTISPIQSTIRSHCRAPRTSLSEFRDPVVDVNRDGCRDNPQLRINGIKLIAEKTRQYRLFRVVLIAGMRYPGVERVALDFPMTLRLRRRYESASHQSRLK